MKCHIKKCDNDIQSKPSLFATGLLFLSRLFFCISGFYAYIAVNQGGAKNKRFQL